MGSGFELLRGLQVEFLRSELLYWTEDGVSQVERWCRSLSSVDPNPRSVSLSVISLGGGGRGRN